MIIVKRFLLMIQFLTRIPLPINLDVKEEDFGKGLVFAPLVGLVLGGCLVAGYYVLNAIFPPLVTAIGVIIFYIVLTGGLHIDGLGDTFDGLFSNRSKEKILEIMRDSRVGTNAVLAVICLILINIGMLSEFTPQHIVKVLLLMPVAGRIGSLVGSGISTYARRGEGLGKSFIDYCGYKEIVLGLPIYFIIFYAVWGGIGLIASVISAITATVLTWLFSRKIGGSTGDILGAVCELNQTLFLIYIYIIISYGGAGI
jgi:adenosylcobinamide-GDP ribazoletransferase